MTSRPSRDRRRLLVLATTVPAREDDGTPAFVLTLAQALGRDNDVTILTPRVRGAAASERSGGVEIRRFPYFPRRFEGLADGAIMPNLKTEPWRLVEVPPLLLAFFLSAVRETRRLRPDLIHAHWLLPSGLLALFLRRIFGTPYIVTAHAADVFRFRGPTFRRLKRLVIANSAVVSPVSAETAGILGLSPEEAQRLVVPMGVNVARIQEAVGERAPKTGRFLFVGRLVEKKGVDVLLNALIEVPDGRLVVIGDGPERPMLEALTRERGLSGRVAFVGQQGQSRVAKELREAHALVVPSRVARDGDADGMPVIMSEGMVAGVPVVASRLGGLSEQITSGENGLLVEPDDPGALAEGLRRVLADSEGTARWREAARRTVREQLDVRVTAQRYQEFIDAALERPDAGGPPSRRRP
jgi:glycosyltransferase involved in cell wall biosynthesis